MSKMVVYKGERARVVLLLGLWLGALALVGPTGHFSLFDDWVYSWAARRLALSGSWDLPEWSSVFPLFQAAWGAAFVRILGPDELVLRLSNVVLAVAGNLCWYSMLRRRGLGPVAARWATATVLFNPVYFLLALSFMTDVFFVSLWQISLWAFGAWTEQPKRSRLIVACAVALALICVRQTGLALLAGLVTTALLCGHSWRQRPGRGAEPHCSQPRSSDLAPTIVGGGNLSRKSAPYVAKRRRRAAGRRAEIGGKTGRVVLLLGAILLGAAPVYLLYSSAGSGLPLAGRIADLRWLVSVQPGLYLQGTARVAAFVGLAAAPAAVLAGRPSRPVFFAALALGLLAWAFWGSPILVTGTMWGACELGGARSLLAGRPPACAWQETARALALVASAGGLAALLPRLGRHLIRLCRDKPFALAVSASFSLLAVGMMMLWLFADRYWLTPAVLAPALVLGCGVRRPRAGAMVLLLYAVIAVAGSRDVFSFYGEVNTLADRLVQQGVSAISIDSGYAVNGRRLYLAMPRAAARQGRNHAVAWVSGVGVAPYTIANHVEVGWRLLDRGERLVVETPQSSYSALFGVGGRDE